MHPEWKSCGISLAAIRMATDKIAIGSDTVIFLRKRYDSHAISMVICGTEGEC